VTVAAQGPDELWNALEAKLQGLDLLKLRLQAPSTRQVSVDGQDRSAHWERLRLPNLYTPQRLGEILAEVAAPLGARLVRPPVPMEEPEVGTIFPCLYAAPKGEVVRIDWVVTSKPRICLIIDDGGYKRGEALEHLYGFRVPVTVSIIPHTQFSHELAQEFPEHGVEVMCHLPMQGHEKVKPGDYREYLKRGMNTERAKEELGAALADLPNCRGLNNHMGSIATTDLRLMKTVCQGLKDRGMFVIDSRTTARAVVTKAAKTVHVPVAQRQTFLDNVERSSLILKQLRIAAAYAKKHGQVVAIGHFKVITLKTLETAVHDLEKEGYQFVYASEVVKP
jgi:polysaccharide deacetylase 2 family uncharacterized protein YibQ